MPTGFQNSATGLDLGLLRGLLVFVEETAEDGPTFDPLLGKVGDGVVGPGRAEFAAALGALSVVAAGISGEDRPQVPFTEDQHPGGEHERFGIGVRPRASGGIFTASMPTPAGTASNDAVNCPARSRTRNRKSAARSPRSIMRFRVCWVVHGPSGLAVIRGCTVAGIPLRPENGVEVRRRIAIMPESPGLYLRLSVAENLECFADLYDAPDPKDRIDGALRAVGGSRQTRKSLGSRRKSLRSRSHQHHGPHRAIRNASYTMARTTGWKFPLLTGARPGTDASGLPGAASSSAVTAPRPRAGAVYGGADRRVGRRDGATCLPPPTGNPVQAGDARGWY